MLNYNTKDKFKAFIDSYGINACMLKTRKKAKIH